MNSAGRTADTPDTARASHGRFATHVGGTVMTFAAVTLLGMTMGQPLGPDYYPMNSRTIKLPIDYKKDRKTIRHVLLYVAHNGENTWYQEGYVTPDKDSFVYVAKDDGIHWFKMVIEYMNGTKDVVDLTRDPPDMKMVIDTTPPQIRVTNAKRSGEEIVIEWSIEDKFPNDAETKITFCATGDPTPRWQAVTRPDNTSAWTGVRFPCGTPGGITVKITAADIAGNRTEVTKDFPGAADPATTVRSTPTPPAVIVPVQNNAGVGALAPPPPNDMVIPAGPIAPPGVAVKPYQPPAPPAQPAPQPSPAYPPAGPPAEGTGGAPGSPQPLPTVDPKAAPSAALPTQGAAPPGGWGGSAPPAEIARAQVISYPRFDLGYDLEQRGPSGISRVDLWVTRDEGKSWRKWSQHDGKNGAVRVTLDVQQNAQQLEGNYGFRLVPVSGAGLSEREPVAGDAPDMRLVLDVTPPQIDLFPPVSDPNNLDTLIIQWKAIDRNFGDDPITLEWSESAAGPWHPIASAGNDPVVQATALNAPVARRLANTGQYGWRVPAGTPARVYLKATARDAAGNVTEKVTRDPITVDLTKPRARINGITPPVPRP